MTHTSNDIDMFYKNNPELAEHIRRTANKVFENLDIPKNFINSVNGIAEAMFFFGYLQGQDENAVPELSYRVQSAINVLKGMSQTLLILKNSHAVDHLFSLSEIIEEADDFDLRIRKIMTNKNMTNSRSSLPQLRKILMKNESIFNQNVTISEPVYLDGNELVKGNIVIVPEPESAKKNEQNITVGTPENKKT